VNAVLGIETSCDECSAAVVQHDADPNGPGVAQVLGISTFSQVKIHQPYGGVVPEIASRNHLETINPMIEAALSQAGLAYADLAAVAVTNRPGLVGALLVGVSAAKAMAYAVGKPLLAVHHLEGHISSLFLDQPRRTIELPLLVAVVSGGNSSKR
jgi:N6-L-threonylcarbamoyladenine synthase